MVEVCVFIYAAGWVMYSACFALALRSEWGDERKDAARMLLLAPLWPLIYIALAGRFAIYVCRTAFGREAAR